MTESVRSSRAPILAALLTCMTLVAMEGTIVATAVPSIVKHIGGFAEYPWLFSIYLLTSAVTVPLYGKLADVVGRKKVLFFGLGVFIFGSLLCGVAWNMLSLILFRAIQGIGAGAVLPMTITIVGDLYTPEERGRIQGYISSVWGGAAVIGPAVGGLFSDYLSWRWIFLLNLPVGAVAIFLIATKFHETVEHRKHQLDYAGATTLTVGCSLLLLGLLEGGEGWAWNSGTSIAVFAAAAVFLIAFTVIETQVAEPVLPLWVFQRRTLLAGNLASLTIGALSIGLVSYVPTYMQGVRGTGAVVAGFTLGAMSFGWPIASAIAARLYTPIGFRTTALIGCAIAFVGTFLFSAIGENASVWHLAGSSFVVGVGLGFMATSVIVAVQSVVGWERRGVVTAANMFMRSIGSALGAAIFGAVANRSLTQHIANAPAGLDGQLPQGLDTTTLVLGGASRLTAGAAEYIRGGLFDATHLVFMGFVGVAAFAIAFHVFLPQRPVQLEFAESPAGDSKS